MSSLLKYWNGSEWKPIMGSFEPPNNSIISKEVPAGAVNGSNTTFTTNLPYVGGSLQVFINGLAQSFMLTETTPTSGIFNLDVAPLTGDDIVVSYMYAPTGTGNADTLDGNHGSYYLDRANHTGNNPTVRTAQFFLQADGAGGATAGSNEGPAVDFTGNPTGYARGVVIVPGDYIGGDISINLLLLSTVSNTSRSTQYYIGCHGDGTSQSNWNIASAISSQTVTLDGSTVIKQTLPTVVPESDIAPNHYITFAWRTGTISGTIRMVGAYIEYTASN